MQNLKVDQDNMPVAEAQTHGDKGNFHTTADKIDDIPCNDGNMQMEIVGQEMRGKGTDKHVEYQIKGQDSIGAIDVSRRFSQFYLLRSILFERYPGIYVPPLPPKQASGNKKDNFVLERMYFLDQFLLKISSTYYIAKTPELQLFLRPEQFGKPKVEDALKQIAKTNTDRVLQYFYGNIKISSPNQKEGILQKYTQDINDFVKEQKVLMGHLRNFK